MKKVLFVVQFFCLTGFSQSIIMGTVRYQGTHEPMPFVNVYLASTSMGTSSAADGTFRFTVAIPGRYEFMASFVGYSSFRIPVIVKTDSTFSFEINLTQKSSELPVVVVRADTSSRKKDFAEFKRLFIGESGNASSCVIKNPKDIYIYNDKTENVFLAYARAPIVVENRALGYLVHYDLEKFEFNTKTEIIKLVGVPRFEEMPAKDERKKTHWSKARQRIYLGSFRHLMFCILNNRLQEEGWKVVIEYTWLRLPEKVLDEKIRFHSQLNHRDSVDYYKGMSLLPPNSLARSPHLHGKEILSSIDKHTLAFKGTLLVEYEKRLDDRYNATKNFTPPNQISKVIFLDQPVKIYDNGFYDPQHYVYIEGYLTWISRICDLLPFDFHLR